MQFGLYATLRLKIILTNFTTINNENNTAEMIYIYDYQNDYSYMMMFLTL